MTAPRFLYAPVDADPSRTLYVDGAADGYRSLSHWPGNQTPKRLKRDLSTGIALAWAALAPTERERLVGHFDQLANNHYDTDGVLSAWAVLEPQAALESADLLIRAATTGDFGTFNGADALALELTLMGLPGHPDSGSPVPWIAAQDADQRKAACYAWSFEHLPALLADPVASVGPWEARFRHILRDVELVDRRAGVSVETDADRDLAVVVSDHTHTRLGLNQAAGDCHRVLLARQEAAGTRCRFAYRVESWFELATRQVPARVPLDQLVQTLNEREPARSGSARWWSTALEQPVAQLGYSDPALAGDGFSEDPSLERFPPSGLPLDDIVGLLRDTLASP